MNSTATARSIENRDFSLTMLFDRTPDQVFSAITNARGWWSKALEGRSEKPGDVFTFRHLNLHRSTHRVTIAEPGRLVEWHTDDAELSHAACASEWVGTDVRFEIRAVGSKTELKFTHVGLVPELSCFQACTKGWGFFVGTSLRQLITEGQGQPVSPETANEHCA